MPANNTQHKFPEEASADTKSEIPPTNRPECCDHTTDKTVTTTAHRVLQITPNTSSSDDDATTTSTDGDAYTSSSDDNSGMSSTGTSEVRAEDRALQIMPLRLRLMVMPIRVRVMTTPA